MKDYKKVRANLERMIKYTNRSTPKDLIQDMIQVALIEYAEHQDLRKAVSAARREERRCTKGARFGEISLDNINLVAIDEADKRERSEIAKHSLLILLHMPTKALADLADCSVRWANQWKNEIRELLDLPNTVGARIRS